ncbi:thiosulfate/3-mercaptopyruvate sulfurtransferase [Bradyrhizobium sp. AZCC 1610]
MTATNDPLVSTDWLAAHLNDPNVRVIDASFKMPGVLPLPKDDYLASHIPGAVFFDVDAVSDHSNPLPHMFPSADQFGRDVGGLGIGNDDTVVLYDSGGWVAAPRVWWMFLSFGKDVRVLNGGLKKWVAEGRKVEKGEVTPKPATFRATFDARRTRSMQQLVANLSSRAEQVIDARANERYQGKVAEPRPGLRSGHIPGSLSLPYNNLFDASTGTMKSLDELRTAFLGAGVKLDVPIVTSCGSGVSAAVLTLVLYRLGVENPALYDGSWTEWGAADGPPRRDRPGLIPIQKLPRCARDCQLREWIGQLLLSRQRRLSCQVRPPHRDPPPFPHPLRGTLFDGAVVRLRFRRLGSRCFGFRGHGRRLFVDDDSGTAERCNLRRGDVAFE